MALLTAAPSAARAEDQGRVTITEENDYFAARNRDRFYTQGLRFSYLSPDLAPDTIFRAPAAALGGLLPIFEDGSQVSRRLNIEIGQNLYTPTDKRRGNPDRRDWPYAGYLYAGIGYIQDTDQRVLERLALQLGAVGPQAQGEQTQNRFHLAIDTPTAQGWGFQLGDEWTFELRYDRRQRYIADLAGPALSVDAIPSFTLVGGLLETYGAIGGRIRIGSNLRADYGPPRSYQGPTGTDYFNGDYIDPENPFGWYVFIGTEGRAIARDTFLDGSYSRPSRSLDRNVLVADGEAGVSLFYSNWFRLTYAYLIRSEQFATQDGPHQYGSLTAAVVLPF